MEVGVNIVWSPLTRPLSYQGRGDNGVIFYVIQMTEIRNSKAYDLEDRTLKFAKNVRTFVEPHGQRPWLSAAGVKKLSKTSGNVEDGKQLIRASGSVGSNYIEANEALSRKDFVMRIKICRKEAKESRYWLRLIDTTPIEPKICRSFK
jgi:four helix bundle protein